MKSTTFAAGFAAALLAGCSTVPGASPDVAATATASDANAAFAEIGTRYIDAYAALDPVAATALGEHSHDAELPAIGPEARSYEASVYRGLLADLARIDPAGLTRDNQVDYAMLKNELEYQLWLIEVLRTWASDPRRYNDTATNSIYFLIARDFAPWPERFDNIVSRMEKIPAYLRASRDQIDPSRVSKISAETLSRQNSGILDIVDAALLPEVERSGVPRSRFDAALGALKTAVADQQKWIDDVLVPNAKGDFRLGPDLYDRKMKFSLQSDMTRTELKAKAQAAYGEARSQMEDVARTFPDCATGSQQAVIECALAKTYANRPARDAVFDAARETLATATEFTREKGLVGMPTGPVKVIAMPKFEQGVSVAYDSAPGALERDQPNFYAISPIPDDWTDEQADSFLREYNTYMLHELSIHEGVPGHYLQGDHAGRNTDVLRAVLQSSPFAEGWAVYTERLMAEHDYLGGRATVEGRLFELTMLKMRLRTIVNTLLDIGIQTEGMNRDEAMKLMMEGAFQQEREAAGKWVRAQLSSVQLLSYFTGYEEHLALREEAKQRWGANYDERKYHDAVLSFGTPPVKYARALLFDIPVQ
ncbi:DUF885 family protein [Altererythrobacter salegens]|uniref:DUF885 family protein n=1 Tax=Croceibacterium salegens TaxID=1737568 RepID=A0A6I4SXX6_9SPHN|nr:DUF885 domain-containing protein [Croceibacterium salegens]MXO60865.1 DUF885 family protein [Croceibacterium salegens]